MEWIGLVKGSLLWALLLIGRECLLKGRRLITIWSRLGLRIGLIAVLLLICGFRLLTATVWMYFIIRICVEISYSKWRLHIVTRTAARSNHSFVIILAVVGFVCVIGRWKLLSINWIESQFLVSVARILLNLVWFTQTRIFCWIGHSIVATCRPASLVRLYANHVSTIANNN